MRASLTWILPALFLTVAVVYAASGRFAIASLYVALAAGVLLHAVGVDQDVAPMQWFGAGIAGFALVVLLWLAF